VLGAQRLADLFALAVMDEALHSGEDHDVVARRVTLLPEGWRQPARQTGRRSRGPRTRRAPGSGRSGAQSFARPWRPRSGGTGQAPRRW
jgi:hypothetical protein